jgi:hypothetical protein
MRARNSWATLAALVPVIGIAGAAAADHINNGFAMETRSTGSAVVQPAPATTLPPVVVQPGQPIIVQQPGQPSTVVQPVPQVVQPAPQMVQAEDLEANEVRANTIYANKIEAQEIQGAIHPTSKVRLHSSVSDMKAPTVVASILYADTIKAHRIVANHIFVQELERR